MFPKYGVPVDGTGGLQNWTTIDFLRSLVIIAMFVVAMLVEPCARICFWLRADSIASAVLGFCCYFFPSTILDHIALGQIDKVHMQLVQAVGATLVGISLTRFSSLSSEDNNVSISLLISNLVGGVILVHTLIVGHYRYITRKQRLSEQHLTLVILGCLLWTVGNFFVLMRLHRRAIPRPNVIHASRASHHILFDIIVKLPLIFCCYGFPDRAFHYMNLGDFRPDGVHAHLLRILATLLILTTLYGLLSMHFMYEFDRQAYFLGHILLFLMLLPVTQLHQWMYREPSTHVFVYHFFILFAYHINCLLGYVSDQNLIRLWQYFGLTKQQSKR